MCLCNVIGQANHFGSHKQFKIFNLQAILGQVVNEILLKEKKREEKRSQCKFYIYTSIMTMQYTA